MKGNHGGGGGEGENAVSVVAGEGQKSNLNRVGKSNRFLLITFFFLLITFITDYSSSSCS